MELEKLLVVAMMGCGHDGNEEQIVKQSVQCGIVLVSILQRNRISIRGVVLWELIHMIMETEKSRYPVCKLENQESWWDNSVPRPGMGGREL